MPFFDLPLDALLTYRPESHEPADFDAFWQATLVETRRHALDAVFEPVDFGLDLILTYDVTFSGYGGQHVKGWLMTPAGSQGPLPCVVEYLGYGGGRGFPTDWLLWPTAGYAHLVMDSRGQGSSWLHGDTPDLPDFATAFAPGFMTQGILAPRSYYYRRLYCDAVRAVEAARSHPEVDAERIAVTGGSQGGGMALAVSGLLPDVAVAMPDVPFLCHFRRAIGLTDKNPYTEIVRYLSIQRQNTEAVFQTLDYFDGVNLAPRAQARALFSTALMDMTCPPSTVFAAFNNYAGPKDIRVYDFNEHEGGGSHHKLEKLRYLNSLWRSG